MGWGKNNRGQLNVPAGLSDVTALAAGFEHSLALKSDGTVVAWGLNSEGQIRVPAGLADVVAIAAGDHHNLAIKSDGTVVAWGWNKDGQCDVPNGLRDVIAVAGGGWHSLALTRDGTVVAWGRNHQGQTRIPSGLANVKAIAAGYYFSVALKSDGTVSAWGGNDYGQTNVPKELTGVTAISTGHYHTVALKKDGTLVAWGHNEFDSVSAAARISGVTAVAAGALVLKRDGTVHRWGLHADGQLRIPDGLPPVSAIAAHALHSLALVSPPRSAPVPSVASQPVIEALDPSGSVGPGRRALVATDKAETSDDSTPAVSEEPPRFADPEALSQLRNLYRIHLAQFEGEYNTELDAWSANYEREVEQLRAARQQAGDLDGWQVARQEAARFAEERVVPNVSPAETSDAVRVLQSRYRTLALQCMQRRKRKTDELTSKYAARLLTLQTEATRAGRFEEALHYKAEAEKLQSASVGKE